MECQKLINLLDNKPINHLNLGQKIGLKQMMTCVERITLIVKLNLKLRCLSQFYVIIVMYT